MALAVESVRTVVVVTYDEATIKGEDITVIAADQEKKEAKNSGSVDVYFPKGYDQPFSITIRGSLEGEESGTLALA